MLQVELIQDFLSKEHIAVVGVSRKNDIPANYIFDKLKDNGYSVYPINPNTRSIKGEICYDSLHALPMAPEAVLLAGTPEVSAQTIDQCVELKIPIVWMHRGIGAGSYSKIAEEKCKRNGIEVITNGCPMMFIGKVDWFHLFLKWLKK